MARWMGVGLVALGLLLGMGGPAAAQCGVFKTWALNEILTSSDINQSFNRTVSANTAACATGDSSSVGQMRVTVDPYPGSAESLATTIQGELERLRFQLNALTGKTYWYQVIDNSLAKDVPKHWGATFTSYAEIADPTPPGPNDLRLYAKDDGAGTTILAYRDSNGIVNALTGPSTSYGSSVTVNYQAKRNPGTPDSKLDISADRISVAGFIKASFAVTIDATTTGANALDTGTLAASGNYAVWVIHNAVTNTFAGLLSTSTTAPTMPSGYTSKRLMGAFLTDGAAHLVDGVQRGSAFSWAVPRALIGGTTVTVATSADLSGHVPQNAVSAVWLTIQAPAGTLQFGLHWQTWAGAPSAATTPVYVSKFDVPNATQARLPMVGAVPYILYYATATGVNTVVTLTGWEIEWKD